MDFLQQYKDHMQLHDAPKCHFCYHQDCDNRFVTVQQLKDHVKTHQPLRAQCYNPDCKQIFPSLPGLYDHEWRHYVPAPQRQEVDALASTVKQMAQNTEAPWKQRVKIEEIWLQSGKEQKELSKATQHRESCKGQKEEETPQAAVKSTSDDDGRQAAPLPPCASEPSAAPGEQSAGPDVDNAALYNGHAPEARADRTPAEPPTAALPPPPPPPPPPVPPANPFSFEEESLDVKACTTRQAQVLDVPPLAEDKASAKCDGSPQQQQAHFHSAPLTRLPPSAYLTESELKMPRRREAAAVVAAASEKYLSWKVKVKSVQRKEEEEAAAVVAAAAAVAAAQDRAGGTPASTKRRCDKCLSSYGTPKELEEHQALNKCSALFGFDTDDES